MNMFIISLPVVLEEPEKDVWVLWAAFQNLMSKVYYGVDSQLATFGPVQTLRKEKEFQSLTRLYCLEGTKLCIHVYVSTNCMVY